MFNTIVKQTADQSWVAFVTNEVGTVLVSVRFNKQQILNKPVFVVDHYFVSREVDPMEEAQTIGNLIDQEIAKLAAQQGIASVLLIIPQGIHPSLDGEALYERKVFTGGGGIPKLLPRFDGVKPSQVTQYAN